MANQKIKNWHLDDSLRLQIESGSGGGAGSSVALEAALAQYVKKTDKITRTQLADSVFDNVNKSIGNLRNELGQYRAIATPIGRSDLSSALQTELDTLALTASSLPADFDTRVETAITNKIGSQEFEDQIVELVTEEYASSISTLQSNVGTLQTNLGTLQNNVSAIQLNVGTLQTDYNTINGYVSDLRTSVGDSSSGLIKNVSDNTSSISTINSTLTDIDSSISGLTTRVGALESQNTSITDSLLDMDTTLSSCRLKTEKIEQSDLSTPLQTELSEINNLKTQFNNLSVSSFSILIIDVAKTQSELNTLKTNLSPAILYKPSMMAYAINQKKWNEYANIIIDESSDITYANHTLSSNNVTAGSLTPSIGSGLITTNNNTNDFVALLFGIYGKNLKLDVTVPSGSGVLPMAVIIDKQLFTFDLTKESSEVIQSIYIENLSHGAHRIEIMIPPNTEFKMSSDIGITDDSNSGLLISSDIPAANTYDSIMYNNVNYFNLSSMNGTYTFTEPTNFDIVDSNSYVLKIYDMKAIDKKILYSKFDQKAYIVDNREIIDFTI